MERCQGCGGAAEKKVIAPIVGGWRSVARNQFFRSLDNADGRGRTISIQGEAVYPFAPCLPKSWYTGGSLKN